MLKLCSGDESTSIMVQKDAYYCDQNGCKQCGHEEVAPTPAPAPVVNPYMNGRMQIIPAPAPYYNPPAPGPAPAPAYPSGPSYPSYPAPPVYYAPAPAPVPAPQVQYVQVAVPVQPQHQQQQAPPIPYGTKGDNVTEQECDFYADHDKSTNCPPATSCTREVYHDIEHRRQTCHNL